MKLSARIKIILLASVIIQLFWLTAIFVNNTDYLFNYTLSAPQIHYYMLGYNMVKYHTFSYSLTPPLLLNPVFTPGYPLLIAFAIFISETYSVLLTIIFQMILYIMGTVLLYKITRRILNERIAFIAAILMCIDLISHAAIYQLMTETFYTTVLLLAVWLILEYLDLKTLLHAIFLGIVLALLVYVRPAALYLVLFVPIYLLFINLKNKRNMILSMACLTVLLIMIIPWFYRNDSLFNLKKLSFVDAIIAAFFTAGCTYSELYGISQGVAEQKISKDFDIPQHGAFLNFGIKDSDYSTYYGKLKDTAKTIILNHPGKFITSTVKSPIAAMLSHAAGDQAKMLNKKYVHIGRSNLLKLKSKNIFENAKQNLLFVNLLFIYEIMFNLLNLILFICGLFLLGYRAFIKKADMLKHPYLLLIYICTIYLFLVTSSIGATNYYRYRIPNMPFVFIFAAFTIDLLIKKFLSYSRIFSRGST